MQSKKFRLQMMLLGGAIVLIALLYLAPRTVPADKETAAETEHVHADFAIDDEVEAAKRRIGAENSAIIEDFEQRINKDDNDPKMLQRLAAEWELNNEPALAAYYYSLYADESGETEMFVKAGDLYYQSFRSAVDSVYRDQMAHLAIDNYRQAVDKGDVDNQTKTNLGVLIVETTANPMQGITLLREVVQNDPENESAQLQLGFFSFKSGQYDKAVERFEKVLVINPARTDALLYIGEAYLARKENSKAIEYFERFLQVSENNAMKREVEEYIKQVKNSNN
ncbi:MAG: tetratricopeptide repeat protein [Bacteroidia bacterium]